MLQAFIMYLMQMGMDPGVLTATMGQVPSNEDALSQQKSGLNYLQDRNNSIQDLFTGVSAGPGGYDYSALDPVVTMEPVDRPGERMLQSYASRPGGTVQSLIAKEIQGGGDAGSAFANIQTILQSEDPSLQEAKAQLLASIPPQIDYATGMNQGPDLKWVMDQATKIDDAVASDPIGNYQDPVTKQWFNRTETPSDAMQAWQKTGLPDPRKEYNVPDMMGADWQAKRAAGFSQEQRLQDLQNQLAHSLTAAPVSMRPGAQGGIQRRPDGGADRRTVQWNGNPNVVYTGLSASGYSPLPTGLPFNTPGTNQGAPINLGELNRNPDWTNTPLSTTGATAPTSDPMPQGLPAILAATQKQTQQRQQADQTRSMIRALMQQKEATRNDLFGESYWRTLGAVNAAKSQGRTPTLDAMTARRMQLLASGLQGGF